MMIGPKRHRIKITRPSDTVTDAGDVTNATTIVIDRLPASMEALRGNELFTARQIQGETTHRFRFRYSSLYSDLGQKDLIEFGGRTFGILYVSNLNERNREFEVLAKENDT